MDAERLLLCERWDFLCELEMVGEEGAFVIGREEVLTEEELTTTLKVTLAIRKGQVRLTAQISWWCDLTKGSHVYF